jgi:hypothetical protein
MNVEQLVEWELADNIEVSTRRKLTPVPLCPSHTRHDLVWVRTRAPRVGSQLFMNVINTLLHCAG